MFRFSTIFGGVFQLKKKYSKSIKKNTNLFINIFGIAIF